MIAFYVNQKYPVTLKVDSRRPIPSYDTLIAFYVNSVSSGNVLVKSTHTDILAILLRLVDVPAVTSLCLLVVRFQNV